MLCCHSKADDADDPRPMEEFSPKEGGICTAEDCERLHNSNMFCEPCDGAAEDAVKKSKECSSESNGEEGEDGHEDVVAVDAPGERGKGVHGVVEDNADTVIEERLAKDKEVKARIDLDLFKDGKNSDGVNGSNERAKGETRKEVEGVGIDGEVLSGEVYIAHVLSREDAEDLRRIRYILEGELKTTKSSGLAQSIEAESYGENIEEGSKHGEDDDGEEGCEELLVVEGDGGIEYDRGQKNVEEEVRAELWEWVVCVLKGFCDDHPKQSADEDEDTRFGQ